MILLFMCILSGIMTLIGSEVSKVQFFLVWALLVMRMWEDVVK